MPVYSIHEHELNPAADPQAYEAAVQEAIARLRVPGLLAAQHLKGFKGERDGRYAVLWIFESAEAIRRNFGTPDAPIWPPDWLHYENEVLAPFLDRHPDTVDFTDYAILQGFDFPQA